MKIDLIITLYSENPAEPLPSLLRGFFPVCQVCSAPGLEVLLPAPGIVLQLFSAGAQPPKFIVTADQPIMSYAVPNLPKAIDAARERGAIVLEQAKDDCTGFTFCYLHFPDRQVCGFFCADDEA